MLDTVIFSFFVRRKCQRSSLPRHRKTPETRPSHGSKITNLFMIERLEVCRVEYMKPSRRLKNSSLDNVIRIREVQPIDLFWKSLEAMLKSF